MRRAALCLLAVNAAACSGRAPEPPNSKYLTVFVSGEGVILADGQEVSLSRLEEELDTAKAANAVIVFAREPTERNRGSVAMLVLRAVQQRQLRLRLCTKRDCSDVIGADGKLRPE